MVLSEERAFVEPMDQPQETRQATGSSIQYKFTIMAVRNQNLTSNQSDLYCGAHKGSYTMSLEDPNVLISSKLVKKTVSATKFAEGYVRSFRKKRALSH